MRRHSPLLPVKARRIGVRATMRLRLVSGLVSSVVITGSFPGPHGPREARGFHEPSTGPLQTTRVGPARRFYDVEWDTVFRRGSLTDSLLQRPRLIAADSARLYVYDHFRHVLMAFTDSGDLLWEYGREGAGPGEFTNPADLEVAPDGTVWLNERKSTCWRSGTASSTWRAKSRTPTS